MAVITDETFGNTASSLKSSYSKQYFDFQYFDTENPLDNLVCLPGKEKFFGTKVLNLFVVGKPYGWKRKDPPPSEGSKWEFDWPPPRYEAALARHKATYKLFASYKTYVWTDWILVKKVMDADEDSDFEDMMETTEDKIKEMCNKLSKYGFKFVKRLESDPGLGYFQNYLKTLYKVDPD